MTGIEHELKELWAGYLAQQVIKPQAGTPAIKLQTEFKFKDPVQCFQCNIHNCLQCCCRNQGQQIRLLLQDLAVLLDNGHADKITGKYSSQKEVEAFLKDPVPGNIYKTPYLKREQAKDGLEECVFLTPDLQCSIWDKAPFICKTYPLIMEQEMTPEKMVLTFSLDKQCSCTRPDQLKTEKAKEYTQRIMNEVICERIEADHTTKLLIYERARLKELGFKAYL